MGFFSAITEQANQIKENMVKQYLFVGEDVDYISPKHDEFIALTNKRIIFVDARIFNNESGVVSIPYSKINKIVIANKNPLSSSKKIEITTQSDKHEIKFLKPEEGLEFYRKLSMHICN